VSEAIVELLREMGADAPGSLLRAVLLTAQTQDGLGPLIGRVIGPTRVTANAAATWIGTAANDDADPDQLESALGSDTVAQIAITAAMSHDQAKVALALLIPRLIDRLSPDGRLPDAQPLTEAASDLVTGIAPARPSAPAAPLPPLGSTNLAHLLRERRRKD
jgi:uncharacterized protein YidB (DUF937 family)